MGQDRAVDWSQRHRPLWIGLSVLGFVFLLASFIPQRGWDLYAYWTVDPGNPYDPLGYALHHGAFLYAPPIALLMAPLGALPFDLLVLAWTGLQLAALWYVGRRWALALIVFPPVWLDLVYGNINILLGAMIVAGYRCPAVWSFALLTKVTPGLGIGVFALRREWRSLALALGTTAILVTVSLAIQGPTVWADWFALLAMAPTQPPPPDALPIPLLPRLAVAAAIVALAGVTSRRSLVPLGVVIAMPTLWVIAFAPLIAIVGLWDRAVRAVDAEGEASVDPDGRAVQARDH